MQKWGQEVEDIDMNFCSVQLKRNVGGGNIKGVDQCISSGLGYVI